MWMAGSCGCWWMPFHGESVRESRNQWSVLAAVPRPGQELPDALDTAGTFLQLLQALRPLKLRLKVALQDWDLQRFGQLPIRRGQTHQPVLQRRGQRGPRSRFNLSANIQVVVQWLQVWISQVHLVSIFLLHILQQQSPSRGQTLTFWNIG